MVSSVKLGYLGFESGSQFLFKKQLVLVVQAQYCGFCYLFLYRMLCTAFYLKKKLYIWKIRTCIKILASQVKSA